MAAGVLACTGGGVTGCRSIKRGKLTQTAVMETSMADGATDF